MQRPLCAVGSASLLVLGVAACAGSTNLELEMSKMRRDLAAMKKDLQDTQLAVQRLESQVTILSLNNRDEMSSPPPTAVATAPTKEAREAAPPHKATPPVAEAKEPKRERAQTKHAAGDPKQVLPVVRLGGKAEAPPPEDPAWVDPGAQDDGSPPIMIQLGADEAQKGQERIAVDHEVLKHPDPILGKRAESAAKAPSMHTEARAAEATSVEIESEYSAALAKLRAEQKPAEAKTLFEAFRAKHPKSNLADNAMYWSAECDFAMKSYPEAIQGFEKLIKARPRSQKVPDALIRIGESWVALGEKAKAKPVLEKVIDSYPKSDAANRARSTLEAIAREGGS
jgi:tol-pal system protein YbgF